MSQKRKRDVDENLPMKKPRVDRDALLFEALNDRAEKKKEVLKEIMQKMKIKIPVTSTSFKQISTYMNKNSAVSPISRLDTSGDVLMPFGILTVDIICRVINGEVEGYLDQQLPTPPKKSELWNLFSFYGISFIASALTNHPVINYFVKPGIDFTFSMIPVGTISHKQTLYAKDMVDDPRLLLGMVFGSTYLTQKTVGWMRSEERRVG